jgi:hypothetical protein
MGMRKTWWRAVGGAAIAACLLGANGEAHAAVSAGCAAVNRGAFNLDSDTLPNDLRIVSGFRAGDRVDFTISLLDVAKVELSTLAFPIRRVVSSTTTSYTFTGNSPAELTLKQFSVWIGIAAHITVTATCTPNVDSPKLSAIQSAVTRIIAQQSGAAIAGSVAGAIDDAFSNGSSFFTAGSNGGHFNFAAEPRSAAERLTGEAFGALAYAGVIGKAPPKVERLWSAWADVRGSGLDTHAADSIDGRQINVTAGLGYKLRHDVLVGVFAGYENFNYDVASLGGSLDGNGGTVGGYAAWRITPTLRWDAMFGWSRLSYDASAGVASGSFNGSRWLASTGLTGSYRVAAFMLEPSAKVYALWEDQSAWTDSLGALHADRSFSSGRVSVGGRALTPSQMLGRYKLSPFVGFYGDWYFSSDDALPGGEPLTGFDDGWSGRATTGVSVTDPDGATLALSGEYGGIGADYDIWTAYARGTIPF